MSNRRLTTRDYKGVQRNSFDFGRWREFGAGLGVGLIVALAVYISDGRGAAGEAVDIPTPRKTPARAAEPAIDGAGEDTDYSFYEMLPKFEVVVPEKEQEVKRDIPTSPIERPGVYVLQAGSYRRLEDAERIKKQLSLQGIQANVQRVAVDADVWHRVRIGPLNDLAEVNRLRSKLRGAELDALVIRVGD